MAISKFSNQLAKHRLIQLMSANTGVDTASAFEESLLVASRQLVVVISGLALAAILARFLDKSAYGNYNYVLAILGTASTATIPGLNVAVLQASSRGEEGFYRLALRISFLGGVAMALVGSLVVFFFPSIAGNIPRFTMIGALFLLPFYAGFNTWDSYLSGKRHFRRAAIYAGSQSVLTALFTGYMTYRFNSLMYSLITFVTITSLTNLFFVWRTNRQLATKPESQNYIKFGFHLTWLNLLPTISDYVDRILLMGYLGPVKLADYAVAVQLPNAARNNLKSLLNVFTPRIAARKISETSHIVRRNSLILVLCGLLLAGAIWAFAPILVPWFFGRDYANVIGLTRLIGLSLALAPINAALVNVILFDHQIKTNATIMTLPVLIRFVSYPIVLPVYGLTGFAYLIIVEKLILFGLTLGWLRLKR